MTVQDTTRAWSRPDRGTMTENRIRVNLGKDAVKLALKGEWASAAELNRTILEMCPEDSEASNRLAKALLELGDSAGARAVLDDLLSRYPNNSIGRKNLSRLEKLESTGPTRQAGGANLKGWSPLFIEEGGKSCTTTLRRAIGASTFSGIGAGDVVTLSVDGDALVVESVVGQRLGTIELRISRRLRKLIAGGNRYSAAVVGVQGEDVSVIIREIEKHPSQRDIISFPPTGQAFAAPHPAESDLPDEDEPEDMDAPNATMDPATESDQEEHAVALVAGEIDDGGEDGDIGVPVLDTDDVEVDPLMGLVPEDTDDWE